MHPLSKYTFMTPKMLFCDIIRFWEHTNFIINSIKNISNCKQYISISCMVYVAKGIELCCFFHLNFCVYFLYKPSNSNFLSILHQFVLIDIIFTIYKSLFCLVCPCNSIPKLYITQATYTFIFIHFNLLLFWSNDCTLEVETYSSERIIYCV